MTKEADNKGEQQETGKAKSAQEFRPMSGMNLGVMSEKKEKKSKKGAKIEIKNSGEFATIKKSASLPNLSAKMQDQVKPVAPKKASSLPNLSTRMQDRDFANLNQDQDKHLNKKSLSFSAPDKKDIKSFANRHSDSGLSTFGRGNSKNMPARPAPLPPQNASRFKRDEVKQAGKDIKIQGSDTVKINVDKNNAKNTDSLPGL